MMAAGGRAGADIRERVSAVQVSERAGGEHDRAGPVGRPTPDIPIP